MLLSSHVLAEVAQIVGRVVIIRGGVLMAETDVAELVDRVTVRVDRPEAMLRALIADHAQHEVLADGAIAVSGRHTAEVGGLTHGFDYQGNVGLAGVPTPSSRRHDAPAREQGD